MTLCARFDTFHLSVDGRDIVYGGRLPDRSKVEIRQPAADADVMIVLMASVFEKGRDLSGAAADSHPTQRATVETAENGDVILALTSRDIRRAFRLDRQLADELSAQLGAAVRRPALRVVT